MKTILTTSIAAMLATAAFAVDHIGAQPVTDINTSGDSNPDNISFSNYRLYFTATDKNRSRGIYVKKLVKGPLSAADPVLNRKPGKIKNLTSHDGGRTFQVIRDQLDSLGYQVQFRVLDARWFAVETAEPTGQIVAPTNRALRHARRIEEAQVGPPSFSDATALAQPVEPRRRVGEALHRYFDRYLTAVARELEIGGGVVVRRQDVEMGSGIGRTDHHARIAPQLLAHRPQRRIVANRARCHAGAQFVGDHEIEQQVE